MNTAIGKEENPNLTPHGSQYLQNQQRMDFNAKQLRLLIVFAVLNVILILFSGITLFTMFTIRNDLSEMDGRLNSLLVVVSSKGSIGSTGSGGNAHSSGQSGSGSRAKSFLITGSMMQRGFNLTVEFPKGLFGSTSGSGSGSGYDNADVLTALRHVNDKLISIEASINRIERNIGSGGGSSGGGAGSTGGSGGGTGAGSGTGTTLVNCTQDTKEFRKVENVVVQQTQQVLTRLGALENNVISWKTESNKVQATLITLQSDVSKTKLDSGVTKMTATTIKDNFDAFLKRPNCISQLSGKFTEMNTSNKKMEQQCQTTETKLAEVLSKVGLPVDPPVAKYSQMTMSFCSRDTGCNGVRVPTTRCYKFVKSELKSWSSAREACKMMGGYLAEIKSELESKEISRMMKLKGSYWIGGTDLPSQGRWQWNRSGRAIALNAWKDYRPSMTFRCMSINDDGWSWKGTMCTSTLGYICQKEANDCNDWMAV